MSQRIGKNVSMSKIIENILEQFLDRDEALNSFEEKEETPLAKKKR